jgi:Phosducin
MSNLQKASVYGQVYPLQKPDYARDVTEASTKAFVLVNLTSSLGTNVESRVLTELWRELAVKYGDVKFCEMRADLCIEGYPERNTPTILSYKDGDIKRQLVTLRELRGVRTSMGDVERLLVEVGAIQENDVRLKRKGSDDEDDADGGRKMKRKEDDREDDDDWD